MQRMRKNEAHLGIIRGDHYWPEAKQTISEEPIIIASKQKITIDQLPHLPRIVYKTDYHLKQVVDNWWYEHFSEPPYITMEVDQIEICRRMVTQGLGYAIFPSTSIVEDEDLFA